MKTIFRFFAERHLLSNLLTITFEPVDDEVNEEYKVLLDLDTNMTERKSGLSRMRRNKSAISRVSEEDFEVNKV